MAQSPSNSDTHSDSVPEIVANSADDGQATAARPHPLIRCFRWLALSIFWGLLILAYLWGLGVLWYYKLWPNSLAVTTSVLWVLGLGLLMIRPLKLKLSRQTEPKPNRSRAAIMAAALVLVIFFWLTVRPSNDRDWATDQARMPRTVFDGDMVEISDVRNASYRSETDYDMRWERRQYDLNKIRSVEYVVEPFSSIQGLAHTLLTFSFDDGQRVAISVEIRKEKNESFSPIAGMFRQYEIMYVIGDERDLIGLRAFVRKDPVYMFPLKADPEAVRALFVAMLRRANRLNDKPQFYHTLTNTCTTTLVLHFERLTGKRLPIDYRIVLPGYSDELIHDLGLLDFEGDVQSARTRFLVDAKAQPPTSSGVNWSSELRQMLGQ